MKTAEMKSRRSARWQQKCDVLPPILCLNCGAQIPRTSLCKALEPKYCGADCCWEYQFAARYKVKFRTAAQRDHYISEQQHAGHTYSQIGRELGIAGSTAAQYAQRWRKRRQFAAMRRIAKAERAKRKAGLPYLDGGQIHELVKSGISYVNGTKASEF